MTFLPLHPGGQRRPHVRGEGKRAPGPPHKRAQRVRRGWRDLAEAEGGGIFPHQGPGGAPPPPSFQSTSQSTVRFTLDQYTGSEKDYHRLLVNDIELAVDLIGWRDLCGLNDGGLSSAFRRTFQTPEVFDEPGHDKGSGGRGRLDIRLASDLGAAELGPAWADKVGRGPVAWIELEAGPLHLHQIKAFLEGEGKKLRDGDYVCAVDRSEDVSPQVVEARALVEAAGARFLHVQVPHAFSQLEEAYAPRMHELSRKRYTLEVIRGLLG